MSLPPVSTDDLLRMIGRLYVERESLVAANERLETEYQALAEAADAQGRVGQLEPEEGRAHAEDRRS